MSANQIHSLVLLIGRLLTLYFILWVIPRQYKVFKTRMVSEPELRPIRGKLLLGHVVMALGQVVPITIDVFGLFNRGSFGLLLLYVYSNNFTALLSAYLMKTVYVTSEKTRLDDEA